MLLGSGCDLDLRLHNKHLCSTCRFGVTQTSAGSSRSSMENGGREREQGAESDEDDDHQQNTSDTGRERCRLSIYLLVSRKLCIKGILLFGFQGQAGQQTSGIAERPQGPRPMRGGMLQGAAHRRRKLAGPISLISSLSLGENN